VSGISLDLGLLDACLLLFLDEALLELAVVCLVSRLGVFILGFNWLLGQLDLVLLLAFVNVELIKLLLLRGGVVYFFKFVLLLDLLFVEGLEVLSALLLDQFRL